jgi:hypothetical protein
MRSYFIELGATKPIAPDNKYIHRGRCVGRQTGLGLVTDSTNWTWQLETFIIYWIIIGNLSRNLPEFLGMKTVVYKELQIFSQDKLGRLLTSTIWDQNKRTNSSVSGVWIAKIFHFIQFLQWFHVISVYNAIAFKHSQQLASGHGLGYSLAHWFWPNNCGKTWQLDKI